MWDESLSTQHKQRGLTLLELMFVLVVLAILASIAIPNYRDYVQRSRRTDAMIALKRVANEQEQFYFDHHRYTSSLNSLNLPNVSQDGFYSLSILTVEAGYVARAIPIAGSSQHKDGAFESRSTGEEGWDPGQDGVYECSWEDAIRSSSKC